MKEISFAVEPEDQDKRIDIYLTEQLETMSRSHIQKLLKNESVFVADRTVRANYKIQAGDRIHLTIPDNQEPPVLPENKIGRASCRERV